MLTRLPAVIREPLQRSPAPAPGDRMTVKSWVVKELGRSSLAKPRKRVQLILLEPGHE